MWYSPSIFYHNLLSLHLIIYWSSCLWNVMSVLLHGLLVILLEHHYFMLGCNTCKWNSHIIRWKKLRNILVQLSLCNSTIILYLSVGQRKRLSDFIVHNYRRHEWGIDDCDIVECTMVAGLRETIAQLRETMT